MKLFLFWAGQQVLACHFLFYILFLNIRSISLHIDERLILFYVDSRNYIRWYDRFGFWTKWVRQNKANDSEKCIHETFDSHCEFETLARFPLDQLLEFAELFLYFWEEGWKKLEQNDPNHMCIYRSRNDIIFSSYSRIDPIIYWVMWKYISTRSISSWYPTFENPTDWPKTYLWIHHAFRRLRV